MQKWNLAEGLEGAQVRETDSKVLVADYVIGYGRFGKTML
jgi:hypothetical protein